MANDKLPKERGQANPVMILVLAGIVLALIAGVVVGLRITSGGADDDEGDSVQLSTMAAPTATARSPSPSPSPSPRPVQSPDEVAPPTAPVSSLTGFSMPHDGACLPNVDNLMPNAPRAYRYGVHEGVDLYAGYICGVPVHEGTPVLAAKSGTVTLALHDYVDLTAAEWEGILARSQGAGATSEDDLHVLRGRQVWLDHGDGISTRYVHLSGIADGLVVGATVDVGQVIAYVGNSGTPESITNPAGQMHLHFEVRVGDSFLGAGLPPGEVRALYEQAFSQ